MHPPSASIYTKVQDISMYVSLNMEYEIYLAISHKAHENTTMSGSCPVLFTTASQPCEQLPMVNARQGGIQATDPDDSRDAKAADLYMSQNPGPLAHDARAAPLLKSCVQSRCSLHGY